MHDFLKRKEIKRALKSRKLKNNNYFKINSEYSFRYQSINQSIKSEKSFSQQWGNEICTHLTDYRQIHKNWE